MAKISFYSLDVSTDMPHILSHQSSSIFNNKIRRDVYATIVANNWSVVLSDHFRYNCLDPERQTKRSCMTI